MQRRPELTAASRRAYPRFDDFVASTHVARVNGYLGGHLNRTEVEAELRELGLPEPGRAEWSGEALGP